MSSFEFNKILAAVILALIVVVIISKVGNIIIDTNKVDLKETAYKIEIPESSRGELTLKNYNTIKVNGIGMDDSDIKLNSGVNLINFSIP